MAKTTGAAAVAERPTDALWLAALPTPRIARTTDRLPVPAVPRAVPAEGALSGLPGAVTDMAVSADGRFLVAAQYGADAVSVIDCETLTVRSTIDVEEPHAVAAAERVYVNSAAVSEDHLVAIDPLIGLALGAKEITEGTRGLVLSPAGDIAFVAVNTDAGAEIAVIDVESGRLRVIPVRPAATVDTLRINADGTTVYAALTTAAGAALAVIDARGRRVSRIIELPGSVGDIAVHRDGRRVFATGWDGELGGMLTVVDVTHGRVVESIAMGDLPTGVVLTGSRAYVVVGEQIIVLSLATATIVDRIELGRPVSCIAVSRDESRLYIADFGGRILARAIADTRLRAAS